MFIHSVAPNETWSAICHIFNRNIKSWGIPKYPMTLLMILSVHFVNAQNVKDLKKLSLEDLMNVNVTLVSKKPEKLAIAASAIQVISNEDIRRSTSARLPEALRLLPNLHVARYNSYATIISARGFNSIFSNKLLVMIDGRSVYSPLFAGVYWDVQNVLMEDIDRIEAVSGPGGTLWGMNAVNGVINVVTKSADETQGLYLTGGYGSYLQNFGAIRYGGKLGSKFSYRVFVQRYDYGNFFRADEQPAKDNWNLSQGGFRIDGAPTEKDIMMFQGNFYGGAEFTEPEKSTMDGQNIMGRWTHTVSDKSSYSLQWYIDRTWRNDKPSSFRNELMIYDIEFQHHFDLGSAHSILWGLGYRFMRDESASDVEGGGFFPQKRNMPLYSSFIQDEIKLMGDQFKIAVGSKFQHNIYSGFEIQPSARLAYTPSPEHTVWGAASRAIRAPSRFDVDYHIPGYDVPPGTPAVDGGPDFVSEKVIAYELGYRMQPSDFFSLSVASFYNKYNDIFSVDPLPHDPVRYRIQNNTEGNSKGVEISGIFRASDSWRLRTGYTYFHKELKVKPGSGYDPKDLGHDPGHQLLIQSMLDLPKNFQLDLFFRYIDELPNLEVPEYFTLDVRLAWMYRNLELSVNGRDLLDKHHKEFGALEVPRNVYGKIAWRF